MTGLTRTDRASVADFMARPGFRLAIMAAFVLAVAWLVDLEDLPKAMTPGLWLGIAASQVPLLLAAAPLGARLVLYVGAPRPGLGVGIKAFFLALGLNLVLPGRISECIKPVYFQDKAGIPLERGMGAVFLERLSDLLIVCVMALTTAGSLTVRMDTGMTVALSAGLLCCLLLFPLLEGPALRLAKVIPIPALRRFAAGMLTHCAQTMRTRRMYLGLLLGLLGWLGSLASIWLYLSFAAPEAATLTRSMTLFVATTLAYAIPALPGGIGTYEAAAVLVLSTYGYTLEQGLVIGIGLHLSQILVGMAATALIVLRERTGVSSLLQRIRAATANGQRAGEP